MLLNYVIFTYIMGFIMTCYFVFDFYKAETRSVLFGHIVAFIIINFLFSPITAPFNIINAILIIIHDKLRNK